MTSSATENEPFGTDRSSDTPLATGNSMKTQALNAIGS